jgi:ProP effector
MDDLLKHAVDLRLSERELKDAIKAWCRGSRYWSCLVEGAPRVDLTGDPMGNVTAGDAGRARQLEAKRSAHTKSPASTSLKSDA